MYMFERIEDFKKNHEYLVCIDSDGCAMDTMDIKHFECFGPCMIEEWGLEKWDKKLLERWNEINLYTKTRGTNRFKTLGMILKEVNASYVKIEGLETLEDWIGHTKELSNSSLQNKIEEANSEILKKTLRWSLNVNKKIEKIKAEDKKAFAGVKECLGYLNHNADLVVVSSANFQAVKEEWENENLLQYMSLILTQNDGSKAFCIEQLLAKGYKAENVLMLGDSPGDLQAASVNKVLFYPILVKKEEESWEYLKNIIADKLFQGMYAGNCENEMILKFKENLHI